MFKRILLDHNTTVVFATISFLCSASIFVAFLWRALRMRKPQVNHFENLPFVTENPAKRHDA